MDSAGEKLEDQRLRREQLLRNERAVPLNAVEEARQHRDLGWEIVRDRYISQRAVEADKLERFGGGEDIAGGFEQAVRDADEVADRRFRQRRGCGSPGYNRLGDRALDEANRQDLSRRASVSG